MLIVVSLSILLFIEPAFTSVWQMTSIPELWIASGVVLLFAACAAVIRVLRTSTPNINDRVRKLSARGVAVSDIARQSKLSQDAVRLVLRQGAATGKSCRQEVEHRS